MKPTAPIFFLPLLGVGLIGDLLLGSAVAGKSSLSRMLM